MKLIKSPCFIIAALMAMAFISSSAMAESTSLCKVEESPCASGNRITHVHEESLGHALLLSFINVECEALFLGDTLNSGVGNPLVIHGTFSYTCLEDCTATEENSPAEVKVLRTGSELAAVTGEALVHVVCGLNCRYNGTGLEGHGLGPLTSSMTNGSVELEEQEVNKESGLFCPSTGNLDILTEPLIKTYIASEGGGGGLTVLGESLMNLNTTYAITIDNSSGSAVQITGEGWDKTKIEGLGSSCMGWLNSGASCSNREFKCVKKGEDIYTINSSAGTVLWKFKCD